MIKISLLSIFCVVVLFLLGFQSRVYAYPIDSDGSRALCPYACSTPNPGTCGISEPGNCGTCGTTSSDCCTSGSSWTKYSASCRIEDEVNGTCNWYWVWDSTVCSTADKCILGEGAVLRAGFCGCGTGGVYKICCNDSGGGMAAGSCQQVSNDGIDPPWEGICPAGSHSVFGTDASVCGPVSQCPATQNGYSNQCRNSCLSGSSQINDYPNAACQGAYGSTINSCCNVTGECPLNPVGGTNTCRPGSCNAGESVYNGGAGNAVCALSLGIQTGSVNCCFQATAPTATPPPGATATPTPPPSTCPNGSCSGGETCASCPADCGTCPGATPTPTPPPAGSPSCSFSPAVIPAGSNSTATYLNNANIFDTINPTTGFSYVTGDATGFPAIQTVTYRFDTPNTTWTIQRHTGSDIGPVVAQCSVSTAVPTNTPVPPTPTPAGATISGRVFNDLNNNGIFDVATEPGLAGSTVTRSGSATPQTTSSSGQYSFPNINIIGNYTIAASVPGGYVQSTIDVANPKTVPVNPATGTYTANFAMRQIPDTCTGLTANPGTVSGGNTSALTLNGCTTPTPGPTIIWNPPVTPTPGPLTPTIGPLTPTPYCGTAANTGARTSTYTSSRVCNPIDCINSAGVTNTSGVTNTYSTSVRVNPNSVITGSVYADTAGNNCGAGKTAVPGGTLTIRYDATLGPNCTTPASGICIVNDVTNPCSSNRTITLSGVTYDRVLGVKLDGSPTFDSGGNLVGFQYKLPSNFNDHSVEFCVTSAGPWFKTTTGDVRMSSVLNNPVPLGKYTSDEADNPSIFYSSTGNTDFGDSLVSSPTKNWIVNNEFSYQFDTENRYGTAAYTYYLSRASHTNTTILSVPSCPDNSSSCALSNLATGVYKVKPSGELNITSYSHLAGAHVVLLIDGNVRISGTIKVPSASDNLLIVAAKGNVTIDKNLGEAVLTSLNTNIEGVFTAENNIILESKDNGCATGTTDLRLNVGGVLVANALKPFAKSGAGGKIVNNRSLCGGDLANPTYMVQQRLDFITRLASFYKIPVTRWKEVNP